MQRMRQWLHGDEGAVATLVAVLLAFGVLTGMAALTVDVGQLYGERRELQNGADAAALAVAKGCANGTMCDSRTDGISSQYANANAHKDGKADVENVCGAGNAALGTCPASGPALTQCPALPGGITNYVEVHTKTLEADGDTLLPPTFARTLLGNDSYTGTTVAACARAAWGPPASLQASLPVTISVCEWENYTANGTDYAPPPPYTSGYPSGYERALYLHNTTDATNCPSWAGSGGDAPGEFGWLETGGSCDALVNEDQEAPDWTGVGTPNDCHGVIQRLVGTIVYVPIFDDVLDNGHYSIAQFAAFYLTGYNLPGASPNHVDSPVGGRLCQGQDKCLYGWFTTGIPPSGGGIGSGPPRGVNVVELVS